MISVRWRPSDWMQFSSLFFKIVHDTGQQLMIDRTNFVTDGFLHIIQRTEFVSVNTRFQIPPKKKKITLERSGERGGHGTSPKREMRCSGNMLRTVITDSFAVCAVAPSCWNHTLAQFIILRRSSGPRPTYWVLPIQKMSGSPGSLCILRNNKTLRVVHATGLLWKVPNLLVFHKNRMWIHRINIVMGMK